jgi:hypothetical protein
MNIFALSSSCKAFTILLIEPLILDVLKIVLKAFKMILTIIFFRSIFSRIELFSNFCLLILKFE